MVDWTGGPGNDSQDGTSDPDLLQGLGGNDTLRGLGGDDTLEGGSDNDLLVGGEGDDLIYGGGGEDTAVIDDNSGHDTIHFGTTPNLTQNPGGWWDVGPDNDEPTDDGYSRDMGDKLNGSGLTQDVTVTLDDFRSGEMTWGNGSVDFTGAEHIYTGSGNDLLDASAMQHRTDGATGYHPDRNGVGFHGGAGDDTLIGSDLRDTLAGGEGNDLIYGGGGEDLIESSAGDDTVYGGDGSDGIRWRGDGGSDGHDYIFGGAGATDAINMSEETTHHVVINSIGGGKADGHAVDGANNQLNFYEFNYVMTGNANDFIDGSNAQVLDQNGASFLSGGGDDTVFGTGANDAIFAGYGADVVKGGGGNDYIKLNDPLFGDPNAPDLLRDTVIFGDGDGNDIIDGWRAPVQDGQGNWTSQGKFDFSGLHDSSGNVVDVNDVVITGSSTPGDVYSILTFPNGESIRLNGISPDQLSDKDALVSMGFNPPPCFVRGTVIACADGDQPVETLSVGTMVKTADHGDRPIRWIGSVRLDAARLTAHPQLLPIRIAAGALGDGLPMRDLWVSPQHRILVRSTIAQRMFGVPEILVAAKQLLALDGIEQVCVAEVEYFHILFDDHEVILSNGAQTESLYTGVEALRGIGAAAREEIFALFPELRDGAMVPQARLFAAGRRARKLAERHSRNHHSLFDQSV